MRPLGDGFIKLIKMLIAPIVFCTVVTGIAQMGRDEGAWAASACARLLYFEVVSTVALVIGLIVVRVVQPGVGVNVEPSAARSPRRLQRTPPRRRLSP